MSEVYLSSILFLSLVEAMACKAFNGMETPTISFLICRYLLILWVDHSLIKLAGIFDGACDGSFNFGACNCCLLTLLLSLDPACTLVTFLLGQLLLVELSSLLFVLDQPWSEACAVVDRLY
jgi:hypothetical protein